MSSNADRGFFRLWVVLATLWIGVTAFAEYRVYVANGYTTAKLYLVEDLARGASERKNGFSFSDPEEDTAFLRYPSINFPPDVILFVPPSLMNDEAIKEWIAKTQFEATYVNPRAEEVSRAKVGALVAVLIKAVIPLLLLLVAYRVIRWVIMGFRGK